MGKRSLVSSRYAPVQRRANDGAGTQSRQASGRSGSLPAPVQDKMEQSFGADFSGVRVHEGPEAAAMGAQAFTQGTDIHFAPGRYDPFGHGGQELIGHELAHVVQQSEGRVQAPSQAKGAAINADEGLEREADEMGARAARGESAGVRGGAVRPSAGVRQLKREPISPAGMSLIGLAKDYYRDLKASVDKSVTDAAALAITQAATALDLGAETNEQFVALAKIFKTGLHANDAEKIRTNVEQKFADLTGEVAAEGTKQVEAEAQELAEGGHALARHGPAVSDAALIKRLHTGIAPDNALVPAPGTSSRFNSHTDVLETRQAAASALQTAIVAAAGALGRLGPDDLRGWHYVLTAGLLLRTPRQAKTWDSAGRVKDGVQRMRQVLEALEVAVPTVLFPPERNSEITARVAAARLGCDATAWHGGDEPGLLVVYDARALIPELREPLLHHRPGQPLFMQAAEHTTEQPVASDLLTYLYQHNTSPWGPGLSPENRPIDTTTVPVEEFVRAVLDAADDGDLAEDNDDVADLRAFATALRDVPAAAAPGLLRDSGQRERLWVGSPVARS